MLQQDTTHALKSHLSIRTASLHRRTFWHTGLCLVSSVDKCKPCLESLLLTKAAFYLIKKYSKNIDIV